MKNDHDYESTACLHGKHERCRQRCKFCNVSCRCDCHDNDDETDVERIVHEHIMNVGAMAMLQRLTDAGFTIVRERSQ